MTTPGYSYDASGNVTGDGTHTYHWDAEGRLTGMDNNTFTYNALGERVEESRGGGSSYLETYWDVFGNPLVTYNRTTEDEIFVAPVNGRNFVKYINSRTDFLHVNALGSTGLITDNAGSLTQDELYYPWGQVWQNPDETDDIRFGGMQERDAVTGFDPTPARQYNNNLGRWMSPDPLAGDISNPQSLNRYAYALNNPTTLTDPRGLSPLRVPAGMNAHGGGLPNCTVSSSPPLAFGWTEWDPFELMNIPVVTQTYTPPGFISGSTPSVYDGYSVSYRLYSPGGWTTVQVGNGFDLFGGSIGQSGNFLGLPGLNPPPPSQQPPHRNPPIPGKAAQFGNCVKDTLGQTLPQTVSQFGHNLKRSVEAGIPLGFAIGGGVILSEPELAPAAPLVLAVTTGQTVSTLAGVSWTVFAISGVTDLAAAPAYCGRNVFGN